VSERRTIRLVREGFSEPPEMDTAVSHATLRRVAEGLEPETLRLHRPADVVAFGPRDRVSPGFSLAVAAAREHGFASIERLAGGRAAVFHHGTIAFSWAILDPDAREGIRRRFDEVAEILTTALLSLGIDARIGEVPGEYCPGEHSINARGRTKLVGVGQRIIKDATHVGGVVVVSGSDRIRDVLIPVYDALDLEWDPDTTGSLEDEVPGITWDEAERAIEKAFGARFDLEEGSLGSATVSLASELALRHALS
jgi:octanoyl-[GcvH]:protein N-octanoyltransferase